MFALPNLSARSLRGRALLPVALSAIALLATTALLLHEMMSRALSERILGRSTVVAHMVANAVQSTNDPVQLRRMVTALGAEPEVELIVVAVGSPPRVLASTRNEWVDRTLADAGEFRLSKQLGLALEKRRDDAEMLESTDEMSYVVPIRRENLHGTPLRGAVAVIVSGRALTTQTESWLWRFGAAVLALEVLALVGAEFGLRRYVLRPIDSIAEAAARRRAGDRTARAPVYADDELGRLATALNDGYAELNATIVELEYQKFALDQAATVLVTDATGIITYVNDAYCRLSGYERHELLGQNPRIVNSGHHPAEFFRSMFDTLDTGRVWRGELCNRARDGSLYWVVSTIIPSLDAAGRPARFTAVLYDISERKLAEQEARAADARFRDVANSAPALIWMSDEDKLCTFFNQHWLEFTGRTHEQEYGNGWAEGVHPDDFARCVQIYVTAFDRRESFEMEYRLRRHDGEYRLILDRGVPRYIDGTFRGYTGSCVDISDRAASENRLRASEARTRQIIDTAIDAVITIDGTSCITGWNLQAEKLFGWTAEEVLGQTLTETIVPVQYRAAHARGLMRMMRTGQGKILGQRVEITALRRDGQEIPVELSISATPIEEGMFFSAFVRDIRERKRVENELVRAKDAAQSASRAKSEFLATMSHEIRTPMNGVIGFTSLLLETGLSGPQREYAETIRSSGEALLALINDILDFSKIEAGGLDVERVPYDARRAAGEVVELLSTRAEESGIELVFEWSAEAPRDLVGDALRFRQVLLNLVGNAIKFTTDGTVFVHAAIDSGGMLRLQVRDSGIGIAADKLANLFRRFTQADSSTTRRFGGTGLGLAICKQLVELMGGTIGVESQPGQGSTFWFTLPIPAEPVQVEPPAGELDLTGLRVLVVDDLEPNRRMLCSQLACRGLEATPASSAQEALVLLRAAAAGARPFRAALLDLRMPVMDGEELGRAILEDPATGTPALLLLTSGSHRNEAGRFLSQGFADVLLKPIVQPEVLMRAIARATSGATTVNARSSVAESGSPAEPPPSFTGRRVLLAEDQPVNQKLALRVLGKLGCSVDLAENGIEACALAAATNYDLILMDCHMPDMDGFEATVTIRTQENETRIAGISTRHTPIVALTASVLNEDRDRCFACGMDDFISKPFRPDQLQAALERWTRPAGTPPGAEAVGEAA
jgi:PAS domain S-box-containing protein